MAWEQLGFCVGALVSDADMASNQFKCVKMSATNNTFSLCDADGEEVLGVLQDNQGSGIAGKICMCGVTKVVVGVGETLVAGQSWGTDASGKAKTVEGSITGADLGDYAAGTVLEGAAAGELATVTVGLNTYKVEAQ
jgi:hypothetical protein